MALDWLQPLSPPAAAPPAFTPPTSTYVPGEGVLSSATQLGAWFVPLSQPLPLAPLPNQQWFVIAFPNPIVPSPKISWFTPLSPAADLPPFVPQRGLFETLNIARSALAVPSVASWFTNLAPAAQPNVSSPQQPFIIPVPVAGSGTSFTLNPLTGQFILGPNPAVLTTVVEGIPPFEWDVSFSFSRLVSQFVQVVAYDPPDQIMLVVFQNGQGTTYAPVSTAQMNTLVAIVQSGADPTAYLSTLTVLNQ